MLQLDFDRGNLEDVFGVESEKPIQETHNEQIGTFLFLNALKLNGLLTKGLTGGSGALSNDPCQAPETLARWYFPSPSRFGLPDRFS